VLHVANQSKTSLDSIQPDQKKQSWPIVYFLLGAFNVLSVGAGLYLCQSVLDIYRASVADSQEWAQRMSTYAELGQLATEANAPGNDVFESGDIDGESRRLEAAVVAFDTLAAVAHADLEVVNAAQRRALRPALEQAQAAVHAMAGDARAIFAAKREKDEARAGARMASMDRQLGEASAGLGQLRGQVQKIQAQHFGEQVAAAGQLGSYQYVLLGLVVVMVVCVVAYGVKLARVFGAKQAEVDRRNQDLRRVLDNVGQGFFAINRAGEMSTERSAVVTTWFGAGERHAKIWEYLARSNAAFAEWLRVGWESVIDDVLPIELAITQLPSMLEVRGHHYRVEYRPMLVAGQVSQVLVVISDVTEEVIRARADEEQKETVAVFEKIMADKSGFVEFFDEADALVHALVDGVHAPDHERRLLHTLKGNAGLFGVSSVARRCHDLETESEGRTLSVEEKRALRDAWSQVALRLRNLLGERRSQRLELEQPEYEAVLSAVVDGAPRAQIAEQIRQWMHEPAERRLSRIADNARSLARRLDKGHIEVDVQHHHVRLPTDGWAPFWSSLTHVIRNAIDHGIEPRGERERKGKAARGQLTLSTTQEHGQLVVEIKDDGRGIDWQALRDRAERMGVPATGDLEALLFVDGLSTKAEVNDISGRGVGMSAVRDAARALGGEIQVKSHASSGTTVRFAFPHGPRFVGPRGVEVRPSITPQA
jgi:HPt (histidine-containing phosphotransfer) domain-containing protein